MGNQCKSERKAQTAKVVTGKIRMSYAYLFTPRAAEEGEKPKYTLNVLVPKSDVETLRKIRGAVDAAKQAGASLWAGKYPLDSKPPCVMVMWTGRINPNTPGIISSTPAPQISRVSWTKTSTRYLTLQRYTAGAMAV